MRGTYHPLAAGARTWHIHGMRLLLTAALVVTACSSRTTDAPPAPGSASAGSDYQALGKKPANARRPTAPPGIEAKALATGTQAPMIEVKDTAGAPWRLADALGRHARVMLVFYRGDW